jgi:hypothetical protein
MLRWKTPGSLSSFQDQCRPPLRLHRQMLNQNQSPADGDRHHRTAFGRPWINADDRRSALISD